MPVGGISFVPTLEPPNGVPVGRFSLQFDDGNNFRLLNCRHGLVLILPAKHDQVVVWDPVNGDQHRVALPPSFDMLPPIRIRGAVLRPAGDIHHFQVVLIGTYKEQHTPEFACVYSSETGKWGNVVSAPLPPEEASTNSIRTKIYRRMACVLVGNSLYWLPSGGPTGVLEFDLDRQSLAVILVPLDICAKRDCQFLVMRTKGNGLGFLFLLDFEAQIWNMKKGCDGVVSWELRRTIELDKLLSLKPEKEGLQLMILGFAEDNNVVFLLTDVGIFMVQLESLQFKELLETNFFSHHHPFESVYTADIGSEHNGADLFAQHVG